MASQSVKKCYDFLLLEIVTTGSHWFLEMF